MKYENCDEMYAVCINTHTHTKKKRQKTTKMFLPKDGKKEKMNANLFFESFK